MATFSNQVEPIKLQMETFDRVLKWRFATLQYFQKKIRTDIFIKIMHHVSSMSHQFFSFKNGVLCIEQFFKVLIFKEN